MPPSVQYDTETAKPAVQTEGVVERPAVVTEPPLDRINRNALNREVLEDPAVASRVRREASALRDAVFPIEFLNATGLDKDVSAVGARLHLLQFQEAAGSPTDPVEKLLLDVLALARIRVARVHALAEQAKSPELIRTYLNTGCRLMSEIAKTALALSVYRSQSRGACPAEKKPTTEVVSNQEGSS